MSSRTLPAESNVAGVGSLEQIRSRLRDYAHLVKLRLSAMVVASGVVGYWLASTDVDAVALLGFTLGTFLLVAGANAFNQVLERDADARMERTARRPLPTGRLPVHEAAAAASLMAVGGLGLLLATSGALPALLGLLALFTYVLVYTPLKPLTAWATFPGAVSGALPTLMGWSAGEGGVSALGWCLFAVLFFWQFPHTWAIAATYREDYERVGYRALPERRRSLQMVAATLALVAVSFVPAALGLLGSGYGYGALVLGAGFLVAAVRFGDGMSRPRAAALLGASLFYLPVILALAVFAGKVS